MTDEKFNEFYWSKTDEERIEISRQLARQAKELGGLTDEEFGAREAKIDRHAKIIVLHKHAEELLHKFKTELELVEPRIDARPTDILETQSPESLNDNKNKKSH
jgi:hypothetical protein